MIRKISIVIACVLGVLPSVAFGELVFAPFESPEYSVGSIVGQSGWIAESSNNGGEAIVDDSRAFGGTQSLMIDTATLGGPSWWYKPFSIDAAGSAVEFSFDLFLESNPGDNYSMFGVDVYNTASSNAVFRLWTEFDAVDSQTYINTSEGITFVPVTRDAWHKYRVALDYARGEYDVFFDGSFVETGGIDVGLVGTTLSDVDIWATGPSGFGDRAWYDNLRVTAVPEPGSAMLTSLALGCIFYRRKTHIICV